MIVTERVKQSVVLWEEKVTPEHFEERVTRSAIIQQ